MSFQIELFASMGSIQILYCASYIHTHNVICLHSKSMPYHAMPCHHTLQKPKKSSIYICIDFNSDTHETHSNFCVSIEIYLEDITIKQFIKNIVLLIECHCFGNWTIFFLLFGRRMRLCKWDDLRVCGPNANTVPEKNVFIHLNWSWNWSDLSHLKLKFSKFIRCW